mmetsp:Transcript_59583/g.114995  ORF Transcript_59583/g.114995 Transcript_59583/m.114995 type:complete len:132 (+) Transcript_59583:2473-2868(+)
MLPLLPCETAPAGSVDTSLQHRRPTAALEAAVLSHRLFARQPLPAWSGCWLALAIHRGAYCPPCAAAAAIAALVHPRLLVLRHSDALSNGAKHSFLGSGCVVRTALPAVAKSVVLGMLAPQLFPAFIIAEG